MPVTSMAQPDCTVNHNKIKGELSTMPVSYYGKGQSIKDLLINY